MFVKSYINSLLFLFLASSLLWAAKTDIVILKNGDHITGEVKRLELGRLIYSTDDMGTISIEWDKIDYIKAQENFRIEIDEGRQYFGSIDTDTTKEMILVVLDSIRAPLEKSKIVKITRIKDTFWDRLDLFLSLGFNIFKANELKQLYYSGEASYQTFRYLRELNFSSTLTYQETKSPTERHNVNSRFSRYFKRKWFLNGEIGLEKNSEQGLDLRISAGGGAGRNIIQTNHILLAVSSGFQVNREYGRESDKYNLEGAAHADFKTFRYDDPELYLISDVKVYPNLSTWGRIRADLNITLKWEIIEDLFWELTFTDNYDSDPPSGVKNVYELIVSFGWSF